MKITLEKSHVLKRVADQKQKELDSCIEKIQKLEEMKNKK